MRHSRECLKTFVRVSISFNDSQLSHRNGLICFAVFALVSHICHIVQIAETKLRCVGKHLRRVRDGFATHALTWRLFSDDFCHTKKYYMFKTFVNSLRPFATSSRWMRGLCDPMRMFGDGLETSLQIDSQNSRKLLASL